MNNFISEKELQERRKKREEEWEKVRKPEDPIEMPEEPYDPRSLFERLQEQKDKKQDEFEESIKFKNQFRGVNKDEIAFLDLVANQAAKTEKQRNDEIKKELEDFRKARSEQVAETVTVELPKKNEEKVAPSKRKSTQSALIMKAVKRKRESISSTKEDSANGTEAGKDTSKVESVAPDPNVVTAVVYPSSQKCIGILPGIGNYSDDSDSNSLVLSSSESDSD